MKKIIELNKNGTGFALKVIAKEKIESKYGNKEGFFTSIKINFLTAFYASYILNKITNIDYIKEILDKNRVEIVNDFNLTICKADNDINKINQLIESNSVNEFIVEILIKEKNNIIELRDIVKEAKELIDFNISIQSEVNFQSLKELKSKII